MAPTPSNKQPAAAAVARTQSHKALQSSWAPVHPRRISTGTLGSMDSYHYRPQPVAQHQAASSELLQYLASTQKHMADWAASAGLPVDAFADAHRGFLPTPRPSGEAKSRFYEPYHGDEQLRKYHEQQKILEQQYILQEKFKNQLATPEEEEEPDYAEQQQDLAALYETQEREKRQQEAENSLPPSVADVYNHEPQHPELGADTSQVSSSSTLTANSAARGPIRNRKRLPAVNPHAIRSARNSLELQPRHGEDSLLRTSRSVPQFDAVCDRLSPFARSRQDSDETIVADATFDDPDMFSAYEFLSNSRVPSALPYDDLTDNRNQGSEISSLVDKFPQPPGENSGKSFALEQYQLMQMWAQRKRAGKTSNAAKRAGGVSVASQLEKGGNGARDALLSKSLNLPAITSDFQPTPPSSPPHFIKPQTVDEWLRYQYADADGDNGAAPMPGPFRNSKKPPKRMSYVITDWKKGRFQGASNTLSNSTSSIASASRPELTISEEAERPASVPASPTEVVTKLPLMKKAVLNEVLLDYTMTVNRLREPALDSQRAVLRKTRSLAALHLNNITAVEHEPMPVQPAAVNIAAPPPSPPPEPKAEVSATSDNVPPSVVQALEDPESKIEAVDAPLNYATVVERLARPNLDEQRAVMRKPAPKKMPTESAVAPAELYESSPNADIIEVHARVKKPRSLGVSSGTVGKGMFRRLIMRRGDASGFKSQPIADSGHEEISVEPVVPIRVESKSTSIRRRMSSLSIRPSTTPPPPPTEALPTPVNNRPSIFDKRKNPRRAASKSSSSGAVSPTRPDPANSSALSTAFGEAIIEAIGVAFAKEDASRDMGMSPGSDSPALESSSVEGSFATSAVSPGDSSAEEAIHEVNPTDVPVAAADRKAEAPSETLHPESTDTAETQSLVRSTAAEHETADTQNAVQSTAAEREITTSSNLRPAVVMDPSSPSSSSSSLVARPLSALSSSSTCTPSLAPSTRPASRNSLTPPRDNDSDRPASRNSGKVTGSGGNDSNTSGALRPASRASNSLPSDESSTVFALPPGRKPTGPYIEATLAKLRGE
ncbi:hypothetical protein HDU86_005685 [Geranomyces michiganensis]|nr:hypothetical protein HDU86_005685 [Geranomyces michiganensis]